MPAEDLSDDYVANLLKRDAKNSASRSVVFGFGSCLPTRPTDRAPKTNTRFLRNIIKDTDSHNAALLAKEKAESKARLRALHKGENRNVRRSPSPVKDWDHRHTKRRRVEDTRRRIRSRSPRREKRRHQEQGTSDQREPGSKSRTKKSNRNSDADREIRKSRGQRSRDRRRARSSDLETGTEDESRSQRREWKRRTREDHGRERYGRERNDERSVRRHSHQHRRQSSSSSHSPGRSRMDHSDQHKHGSVPKRRSEHDSPPRPSRRKRSPSPEDLKADSDPLEDIVGPLPPPAPPKVRIRGRGATSGTAMDRRFADDYDPSVDVDIEPDKQDDWDQALEALRDRQRWKQQGAERLRAAGFTDDAIQKWEKGGEKTEEDVHWAKAGEGREWDRGKLLDEDGDVTVKPEWGRLKGT